MILEDWQRAVLGDIFAGARETLVLLPKGNGKTTLFAALALFHLVGTANARCYIGAASRDQASLMYDHARGFVARSDALAELVLVRAGSREIRSRQDTGFIRVLAADANTTDGVAPTLALVDELHRHRSTGLYGNFRDGLPKRDGQLVTISTAGDDVTMPLGEIRDRALKLPDQARDGYHLRAASADGGFVLHEWAVPDGADTDDLETVKRANPASFVTLESLRARRESASTHERDWLRFACNRWVSFHDPWLPPGAWDACADPAATIPRGGKVWLGVDVGIRKDSSALAVVHPCQDGRVIVRAETFDPPAHGHLDLGLVEQAIRDAADLYHVQGVAYDRWAFERSAQVLSDEGLMMVEFPMTNERTVPASARLYEAVVAGRIAHDGDPILTAHVNAGTIRDTERGWRLSKGKARRAIDALIALMVAFSLADKPAESYGIAWL